MAAITSSNGQI